MDNRIKSVTENFAFTLTYWNFSAGIELLYQSQYSLHTGISDQPEQD